MHSSVCKANLIPEFPQITITDSNHQDRRIERNGLVLNWAS